MTDRIHAGTVTDTECRVTVISADSGNVRLDTCGAIMFITPDDATRMCRSLGIARDAAREQQAAIDADLEPGGATSAWEHHHG